MAVVDWTTLVYSLMPLVMTFVTMFILVYFIKAFGETLAGLKI